MAPTPAKPGLLAQVSRARRALEQASTLDEVLQIRDQAEAVRHWAKVAGESLDVMNSASEIKLRAERKAGAFLSDPDNKAKGTRGNFRGRDPSGASTTEAPDNGTPTYAELGIAYATAHRWQVLARLSDDTFDQYVAAVKEAHKELTSSGLYQLARKLTARDEPEDEPEPSPTLELFDAVKAIRAAIDKCVEHFPAEHLHRVPDLLRDIANELERRLRDGGD